jgi:hypothetical protein
VSFWTKSPQFYGAVAVGLGLIGEVIVFCVTLQGFGSWTTWLDFMLPGGLQWTVLVWTAPAIAVVSALLIGPLLPRVAMGICIVAALYYALLAYGSFVYLGGWGVADVPAMIATCLVGAAIGRDRELARRDRHEGIGRYEMAGAALLARVISGAGLAVGGAPTLLPCARPAFVVADLRTLRRRVAPVLPTPEDVTAPSRRRGLRGVVVEVHAEIGIRGHDGELCVARRAVRR